MPPSQTSCVQGPSTSSSLPSAGPDIKPSTVEDWTTARDRAEDIFAQVEASLEGVQTIPSTESDEPSASAGSNKPTGGITLSNSIKLKHHLQESRAFSRASLAQKQSEIKAEVPSEEPVASVDPGPDVKPTVPESVHSNNEGQASNGATAGSGSSAAGGASSNDDSDGIEVVTVIDNRYSTSRRAGDATTSNGRNKTTFNASTVKRRSVSPGDPPSRPSNNPGTLDFVVLSSDEEPEVTPAVNNPWLDSDSDDNSRGGGKDRSKKARQLKRKMVDEPVNQPEPKVSSNA